MPLLQPNTRQCVASISAEQPRPRKLQLFAHATLCSTCSSLLQGSLVATFSRRSCGIFAGLGVAAAAWNIGNCWWHVARLPVLLCVCFSVTWSASSPLSRCRRDWLQVVSSCRALEHDCGASLPILWFFRERLRVSQQLCKIWRAVQAGGKPGRDMPC